MTKRLYYDDSKLLEFEAVITETGSAEDGYYTVLDQSAFYPTSGGQLHDCGQLNEIDIVDVIETEDSNVRHLSAQPVGDIGQTVRGRIDRERRLRACRNHTGQHILSASFAKLYDLGTVSVHLGEEYAAVEIDTKALSSDQLRAIEQTANRCIADNLPIESLFVDSDKAASLPFRRPPKKTGRLRVIKIGDVDFTACGGTHCGFAGEVRLIKLIGSQKIRGRVLIKFLTGELALRDYISRFEATDRASRLLTCHVDDIAEQVEKLTNDKKQMRADLNAAHKELLPTKIPALVALAQTENKKRFVAAIVTDIDSTLAAQLAGMVADAIDGLAVLMVAGKVVIAAGDSSSLHAGNLARELATLVGLKGGGNKRLAQLGGKAKLELAQPELNSYVTRILAKLSND